MAEIFVVIIGILLLVLPIAVLNAILRLPRLLENIVEEIRESREQAHQDTVALAEVLKKIATGAAEEPGRRLC